MEKKKDINQICFGILVISSVCMLGLDLYGYVNHGNDNNTGDKKPSKSLLLQHLEVRQDFEGKVE